MFKVMLDSSIAVQIKMFVVFLEWFVMQIRTINVGCENDQMHLQQSNPKDYCVKKF